MTSSIGIILGMLCISLFGVGVGICIIAAIFEGDSK